MDDILEKTKNVYALLTEGNKKILCKYASQVPDGGVIVDVGTCAGASAILMALASKPSVVVYTMDPNLNPNLHPSIKDLGLEDKVIYSQETSVDFAKHFDKEIDMLFVDGIHNYIGVIDDYEKLGTKVKRGGIIAFHDVILYSDTIGKAVYELLEKELVEKLELEESLWHDERMIGLMVTKKL